MVRIIYNDFYFYEYKKYLFLLNLIKLNNEYKRFGLYNIIIMGIPSFFSHIVKNHRTIIKKITELEKMNNLYLDSNSIIYDCLRCIEYDTDIKFEKKLLKEICLKIDEYINVIEPDHTILIAFDGVAPVAKLEQQRTRRYKSDLEGKIRKQLNPDSKKSWDTRAITPGTKFMKKLNSYVKKYKIHQTHLTVLLVC